jgi:hypothetical protein
VYDLVQDYSCAMSQVEVSADYRDRPQEEVDSRRRLALGKLGHPDHTRYLVTEEPDGTLILEPAVVMTEHEAALLGRPDLLEILDRPYDPERLTPSSSASSHK